jgi:hypothetical protein
MKILRKYKFEIMFDTASAKIQIQEGNKGKCSYFEPPHLHYTETEAIFSAYEESKKIVIDTIVFTDTFKGYFLVQEVEIDNLIRYCVKNNLAPVEAVKYLRKELKLLGKYRIKRYDSPDARSGELLTWVVIYVQQGKKEKEVGHIVYHKEKVIQWNIDNV